MQESTSRYSGKRTLPYWGSSPNNDSWLYKQVYALISSEVSAFHKMCEDNADKVSLGLSVIQGAASSVQRQRRSRRYRDSDSD